MADLGYHPLPKSLTGTTVPYITIIILTIFLFPPFPASSMTVSVDLPRAPSPPAAPAHSRPRPEKQFYIPQELSDWDNINNLQTEKPWCLSNTESTPPDMTATGYPWGEPGFSPPTLISVEANPTSIEHTILYSMPTPLVAPTVGVQSIPTSAVVPPGFSPTYPAQSSLKPTPKRFDSGTGLTWDRTVPLFLQPEDHTTMRYLGVSPWTRWPLSPHPGVTIVPPSAPTSAISAFFGSLGLARSKAYVIPVDTEGVPGWHKRALEIKKKVVVIVDHKTNSKE